MKHQNRAWLPALTCLLAAVITQCGQAGSWQGPAWHTHASAGVRAYVEGTGPTRGHSPPQYAEAEKQFLAALEKAQNSWFHRTWTLLALGMLYRSQGKYEKAEMQFRQALSIAEKEFLDFPHAAVSAYEAAAFYLAKSQFKEAEQLAGLSAAIWQKRLPKRFRVAEGPDWDAVRAEAKSAEAQWLQERARSRQQERPGMAISLSNLEVLSPIGTWADRQLAYRRAARVDQSELGLDHPGVAAALSKLAEVYEVNADSYAEAESLYHRALSINEKTMGPDHPLVVSALRRLAWFYRMRDRSAAAEPLYRRTLAIKRKALGPEHPEAIQELLDLAEVSAQGDQLYRQALRALEKQRGLASHETNMVLQKLASLYRLQRKYREAEQVYQRALAGLEKASPSVERDANLAMHLEYYSSLLGETGRHAEAASMRARAKAIRAKLRFPR